MRCVFRWSCLLLGLVIFVAPLAAADKKPGGKASQATPQEYKALVDAGEVTGKLTRIQHTTKNLTVQIEYQHLDLSANKNNNANRNPRNNNQHNLLQQQRNALNSRNPFQMMRQMQQVMQQYQRQQLQALKGGGGQNPYRLVTSKKEFELTAADNVKVRTNVLPAEFDEKGKPKQYTAKELKELKGPNSNLPGYTADFDNLAVGQTVKLYVSNRPVAAGKADKGKDVDNDRVMPADNGKAKVSMVLIVKDDGTAGQQGANQKKKK